MTREPIFPPPAPLGPEPSMYPPGPAEPDKTPAWAIAIGVISIIYASLGLICTPVSLVSSRLMPSPAGFEEMLPPWFETYSIVSGLVGMAVAVILLVAGIGLLRRRAGAVSLHVVYGWIAILMGIVGMVVIFAAFDFSRLPGPARAGAIGGAAGGIIGFAYPIFLLIWFSRAKIRQQAAAWQHPG